MHQLLSFGLLPFVISGSRAYSGYQPHTTQAKSDPATVCGIFKQQFSNLTFLSSDPEYKNETQESWSAAAWQKPACVFAPRNAEDLSFAVKTLANYSTPFAMRGGGHMPISDAANINSTGVQISSTNLNTLELSDDGETMSIGPGPRWGDVFIYLDGTNKTIVGGRLAPVGVPGLLLGGGISYFSMGHGLGASNGKIKAYECVLADGTIATVTAQGKYRDLYWALQGGGNSFALVTRFDLQTFPSYNTLRAEASYEETENTKDDFLNALLEFTLKGDDDTNAAIVPVIRWGPNSTQPSYESTLFYNGTEAPKSGSFSAFYSGSLKAINESSTMRNLSLAQYAKILRPAFEEGGQGWGFRQKFRVVPMKATREAMDIMHDIWFDTIKSTGISSIPGFFAGLSYNTVSKTFAEKSQGMPQGIEPVAQFWTEEAVSWSNAEDDVKVEAFVKEVNDKVEAQLSEKDLAIRYIYLNDADKGQPVFESYGAENVMKLKAIRAKYDPKKVFTDLMPGGFKVDKAKIF